MRRAVAAALVATAGLVLLIWIFRHQVVWAGQGLLHILENREEIRQFIISKGIWGPVAFISLQILQVIVSPIPGEATGFIGGFIFGKWWGLVYSTIGLGIGSLLAFSISRQFRRVVQPWLQKSELYWKFEKLLERQGLFVCFFMYVFPGFPKDFLCYLLGLSRMPWQVFVVIATIGRIPGTLMLTWQGAAIYEGNIAGFVALLVITAVVVIPAWIWREEIYAWVEERSLKE